MSHPLVSRSPDLAALVSAGYQIEISDCNLLLVHNVPYVNCNREIARGVLATTLTLNGDRTARPDTHVALFAGEYPCHQDGTPIKAIEHSISVQQLKPGLVANFSFSNKPPQGYADYFEKVARYIEMISAPAKSLDRRASAKSVANGDMPYEGSVFAYGDTASARVGIAEISSKLARYAIGIVGLGGTGAYVLDFVAKTPVREIHLFDGDDFLHHNAFRAPGAPAGDDLVEERVMAKVEYFSSIYSRMHTKIHSHCCYVTEENAHLLRGLDFVFICVDKGSARKVVMSSLLEAGIPFVDVGMGLQVVDDESKSIIGIVRTTSWLRGRFDYLQQCMPLDEVPGDDAYTTNIQIAELNALNAALAVIRWKKHCGFYQDLGGESDTNYTVNVNGLMSRNEGQVH